jgi:ATP-dependent helicase/nuclease subunit A
MKPIGHRMILASAGSGKTYALTNRFVRLLAGGATPERIAALTFTRKAAGEFFDEILKKLARAAGDDVYARTLAGEIERPELRAADFSVWLRAMIDAMPRLNLGTLDGFFARIVTAFPLELGLGGPAAIMEDSESRLEHRRVLRQMFASAGSGPDAAQQDFIEAFKRATFGAEEKRLSTRLDRFLEQYGEVYREAPDERAWGRPERIWPGGCDWLAAADGRAEAARALRAALPWPAMNDGQRRRWEDFLAAVPEWAPGADLPQALHYILGNTRKAWPEVSELTIDKRKLALPPAASAALRRLAKGFVGAELARRLQMTRGIFAILRSYESAYDEAVRRRGRLTFGDLQRLLRPDRPGGGPALSRAVGAEARLFIDWRLDARIDHWLLDEFQDTSVGQWSVLRNLIDEVVQDAEGARSFFYVGDVKQAIFSWRGGDARLFGEIFAHYNAAAPGTIGEERLASSWRSGPAVIALVNRVFGDAAAWRGLFPDAAVNRWSADWQDHASAQPGIVGWAELRHADDEAGRFAATLAILNETGALARGLTVAVLVPSNETATDLAEYLRREGGLAAVAESDEEVGLDNPLTCALLALLRAAAHPGDRSAWTHLRMTPVGEHLRRHGLDSPPALTRRVLGELSADGFERTLAAWCLRLESDLAPADRFSRERARQMVAAARSFDESGGRAVADFLAFMQHHTVRDSDLAAVVRVMTIHKAKGLGFDLVILPDLEGQKLAQRREGLAVHTRAGRGVEWILQLPGSDFLDWDPVLSAHVEAAEADACFERFCLLYVALTRAKRALYVITEPVGKSKSMNFPRLLQATLGETWSEGDPRWYDSEQVAARSRAPSSLDARPALEAAPFRPADRRPARRPSAGVSEPLVADRLFSLAKAPAREFGAAVHALLARVEWLHPGQPDPLAGLGGEVGADALAESRACLADPALAEVWLRPSAPHSEVWRERPFEVVLDGTWISGIFDRVVVERSESGRALRAVVTDFKTDRAGAVERHADQLELYRRAVAILTDLPAEAVAAEIVFTALRRRAALPRPS